MAYFQTRNPNLGKFSRGRAMVDVGIFSGHLVNFNDIWYILWPLGISYGYLVHFPVLVWCTKKNLATLK
jgi:hypothetical protein